MPGRLLVSAAVLAIVIGLPGRNPAAAPPQAQIDLMPKWAKSDARTYERVKSRRKLSDGKVVSEASGRGDVELSVEEATPDGFLVRWVNRETRADHPGAAEEPLARKIGQLVDGMVSLVELDSEATVKGLRNWKDSREKAAEMIDALTDPAKVNGVDPKFAAQLKAQLSQMFATKEQIEGAFLREPRLFFFPLGRSLSVGTPIEYEDQLPNPLGGRPFPCRAVFTLTKYDAEAGEAVVRWDQTMDPDAAGAIMDESLKALDRRLGRIPPEGEALRALRIEDHAEFVVDTRTGWVRRFRHTRSTRAGATGQDDILSMTLRPPAGRPNRLGR